MNAYRCNREPRKPRESFDGVSFSCVPCIFRPPRWQERERTAAAYAKHPALLRMLELEALSALAKNANARIYIEFDKHSVADGAKNETSG